MEIEIVTTKKKLSRSIVNQMRYGTSTGTLKLCNVLGYVVHSVKDCPSAALIELNGEYFVVPRNYSKGETSVYRKIGKWSQSKKFPSPECCDEWWEAYQSVLARADTQIYI